MTDPETVGSLVAVALGLGSEAAKTAMSETVKDAYKALRTRVATWAAGDVDELEKVPTSVKRRDLIAEAIDGLVPDEREVLRTLAQSLIDRLGASSAAIGLDIRQIRALNVDLGRIDVARGTGVRVEDAEVLGTFRTGEIYVGKR